MSPPARRYVLATANPDKAAEVREILATTLGSGIELVPRPADIPEVAETGTTLEENARLKARAICAATGLPAVADDTGLEVDAIGGAPGIYAARYAGEDATYADNVAKLLGVLQGVGAGERTGRFRTVALAAFPDGSELVGEGVVEGTIAEAPAGESGFGYDPVFVPQASGGRTFAEMTAEEKHAVSHRGRAFRALAERLAGADSGSAEPSGQGDRFRAGPTEMATGALVVSVLWLFFLGSVVGLVLGLVARRRAIGTEGPARRIAEVAIGFGALGVVVAGVIAAAAVFGIFNVGALCHPAVTGIVCHLHVKR